MKALERVLAYKGFWRLEQRVVLRDDGADFSWWELGISIPRDGQLEIFKGSTPEDAAERAANAIDAREQTARAS